MVEKMTITVVDVAAGTKKEMVLDMPDGFRAACKAEAKLMCGCNNSKSGIYIGDGQCDCGVHKHHYHCTSCGKITQIG